MAFSDRVCACTDRDNRTGVSLCCVQSHCAQGQGDEDEHGSGLHSLCAPGGRPQNRKHPSLPRRPSLSSTCAACSTPGGLADFVPAELFSYTWYTRSTHSGCHSFAQRAQPPCQPPPTFFPSRRRCTHCSGPYRDPLYCTGAVFGDPLHCTGAVLSCPPQPREGVRGSVRLCSGSHVRRISSDVLRGWGGRLTSWTARF